MLVFILSLLAASGAFAQPKGAKANNAPALTLGEFLGQVSDKHTGLKSAELTAKGAKLYSEEGSLVFKPVFTADGTVLSDQRSNPLSANDRLVTRNYNAGLKQQSRFGLGAQVNYKRMEMESPSFPAYKADWVQLDLSQSLLRNFGGRESRAQAEAIEAGALAKSYSQSYVSKNVLLEAETIYWRLALAREMVAMQKDAVERAQRISDWTNRRVNLQLADRAELLQASTNLQARKLELRTAEDDERAAAQAFNSSRGVVSNVVKESLVEFNRQLIEAMKIPERTQKRDDVKAAEFQAKATAANAVLSREKDKPTLELFGSVPLTEPSTSPAPQIASMIPITSRPNTMIGVRATVPLDLSTLKKAREGWAAEAQGADWAYQRKAFEEERDWQDLTAKFTQTKERVKLYVELEKVQREKLNYERDRQQRGRSTLQQVLLYETDYQVAQLGLIRTLADLLQLGAQMKLYGVSYESR